MTLAYIDNIVIRYCHHLSKFSLLYVSIYSIARYALTNIKEINMGTSDVEQHVQYVGTKLSSSNQDVQIEFDVT